MTLQERLRSVEDRPEMGVVETPVEVVERMLDNVPVEIFESTSTTFLDPAFGRGNFLIGVAKRLKHFGHSKENIEQRIFGVELAKGQFNYTSKVLSKLNVTLFCEDALIKMFDMKFDVVLGNPPYNLRKGDGGVSGTVGNTTFYRKFVTKGFELLKPDGILLMVTLKNVIKHINSLGKQIDSVDLMTTHDYWKYETLIFTARNQSKHSEFVVTDPVIRKIYTPATEWNLKPQSLSLMQLERDRGVVVGEGNVLLKLKGRKEEVYGNLPNNKPVLGPKLAFTMLESTSSYTVTDAPAYPSCSYMVLTNSLEEAEKLKLFMHNSKLYKFFTSKMKSKSHGRGLFTFRKFDLSQIKTGYEYPREFNLTQEEIDLIESTVK